MLLSPVEHSVLLHIARGLNNQETADALHLAVETVRTHVKNIHVRLGANNRAHAVAIAYHIGVFAAAQQTRERRRDDGKHDRRSAGAA